MASREVGVLLREYGQGAAMQVIASTSGRAAIRHDRHRGMALGAPNGRSGGACQFLIHGIDALLHLRTAIEHQLGQVVLLQAGGGDRR
ncbi:hypothetical protein FBY03_13531 [Pseudomonas sp. SJZ079]|nr:hypothetical protein FBY03_13531 [Pseudomonas sp. SJZ079]